MLDVDHLYEVLKVQESNICTLKDYCFCGNLVVYQSFDIFLIIPDSGVVEHSGEFLG